MIRMLKMPFWKFATLMGQIFNYFLLPVPIVSSSKLLRAWSLLSFATVARVTDDDLASNPG